VSAKKDSSGDPAGGGDGDRPDRAGDGRQEPPAWVE